jgi:hypothetical protein
MLQMVGEAMKLRQTGQEFAARQRFGQIMAGAGGDMETALQQAQKDPLVGAFAPQLMTEIRQQMMIGSQAQQAQLGVAKSAREGLLGVLQTVTDPTKLQAALQAQFGVHDRRTQEIVKPYGDSVVSSLTAGLPSDPAAAQQEFAKRKAQMMVSTGLLPNIATAAGAGGFGTTSVENINGVPTPVIHSAAQLDLAR